MSERIFACGANIEDDGTDPTNGEHNFGLLDHSGVDKPAMTALRNLFALAATHLPERFMDTSLNSVQALRMKSGSDTVLALWIDSQEQTTNTTITLAHPALDVHDVFGQPVAQPLGASTVVVGSSPLFVRFAPASVGSSNGSTAATSILDGVRVYPNPVKVTKNNVLHFDLLPTGSTVTIYSVSGRRIKRMTVSGSSLT